jgi:cell division protein FtsQ
MPQETQAFDGDDFPRQGGASFGRQRFDGVRTPWWRPASGWGRVFFATGILIVLGGLAVSAFLFKTYLGRDGRFRIAGAGNIAASGLSEVSRAEMLPVFGEDIGRNIFFVPLAERRKQLEQIPWIERATVMRLLPDQIRVTVVERQPVAFVRQGSQVGLVDSSGVLLAMPAAMMAQHHYSFPVVTGIDPHDPAEGRKNRMAVYGRLLADLDANNQHLSEQISEIDLSQPEDVRILMPEQGTDILAHFGEDHFLERYQRYKAHIGEWRQQYPKLMAVDLRYEQQVVLEMAPGTNPAESPTGQTAGKTETEAAGKNILGAKAPASQLSANQLNARPQGTAQESAGKTSASTKTVETAAKPGARGAQKPKTAAAKDKAARDKKKRAEARRTALDQSKKKKARSAALNGQGQ